MNGIKITCDRQGKLWRVAVWEGHEQRDLYLDRIDRPDLTGAVVGGKVVRVLAGQKAVWLDCGLPEKVYVENPGTVRSGDYRAVKIRSTGRQGKAWVGGFVDRELTNAVLGVLEESPHPWQRAIADLKSEKITSIVFFNREDHEACRRWLQKDEPQLVAALQPLAKEPGHPEMDERIDNLRQPVVDLPGGGNIVIESTEALVAVDVNGGEASNALAVNLLAVREAARQIRLRNLAGIIVIDALKMKARTDKAKVLNALKKATADDPMGVQVFGLTKLGLIEMTRTRRGPSLQEVIETL